MNFDVHHGDCLEVLRTLPDNSVDSVVTDPPYGLSFMGKRWDYDVPAVEVWSECLRVLKPGGHLLAFAGTRTQHRMAVRIEDAGFEIRDMIAWVYGSGFPKSLDVSKAIDQRERGAMVREKLIHFASTRGIDGKWLEAHGVASASSFADWTVGGHVPSSKNWNLVKEALGVTQEEEAAFEREVICRSENGIAGGSGKHAGQDGAYGFLGAFDITAPATEAARQWQGFGTALKPALEPITVARKPLIGTVAENVLTFGTGALNIDGCRVTPTGESRERVGEASQDRRYAENGGTDFAALPGVRGGDPSGRWPANLIHDGSEEVVALFPSEAGAAAPVHRRNGDKFRNSYGAFAGNIDEAGSTFRGDKGSAARFFYCAKASRKDRNAGCEHMPRRPLHWSSGDQNPGSFQSEGTDKTSQNNHPTVKPTDLMRYLCRLVTPPGGVVLDPFTGSGSTGKAAVLDGFLFIGIEREAEYVAIAQARIAAAIPANDNTPQRDLFANDNDPPAEEQSA